MRYVLMALLVAAASFAGWALSPNDTEAADALYGSSASADTVWCSPFAGFVSVEAVSGAVGLRVFGGHFSATTDSLIIQSGDILNIDLYSANRFFAAFAVYPGAGATARYVYW